MSVENKRPVEAHASTLASGPLVHGLFPADLTYRISNGVITPYGATPEKKSAGSFEEELERVRLSARRHSMGGLRNGADGARLRAAPAESASHTSPVAERILLVVNLNCVERYYLAPDLHDALPFLAQLADDLGGAGAIHDGAPSARGTAATRGADRWHGCDHWSRSPKRCARTRRRRCSTTRLPETMSRMNRIRSLCRMRR